MFNKSFFVLLVFIFSLTLVNANENDSDIHFKINERFAQNVPLEIVIYATDKDGTTLSDYNKEVSIEGIVILGKKDNIVPAEKLSFQDGILHLEKTEIVADNVIIKEGNNSYPVTFSTFNAFLTLIPPILAILLAIITKEVLISLFIGVWSAVFVLSGYDFLGSLVSTFTDKIVATLTDESYMRVILFTCTIGGMIGIVSKSGGIHNMVEKISKWATSPRSGMISTWLMGIVIFFDDYANTLIVGNSMKPITDKLKISREKLSYIVDSTAAPVCSIVLISTWIGTELGYIGGALADYGQGQKAFEYFFNSIPFHFYSIYTIVFIFIISYTLKDFGPMYKAEQRARTTGQVLAPGAVPLSTAETIEAPEGKPHRWVNAILPIAVVIIVTIVGLYMDGKKTLRNEIDGLKAEVVSLQAEASKLQTQNPELAQEKTAIASDKQAEIDTLSEGALMNVFGKADSYIVLLWAAFWGSFAAFVLILAQRIMNITQVVGAWVHGVQSMILAILVLVLAWTLKDMCSDLGTNKYIYYNVKDIISVRFLPVLGFIISAIVAFSTGTSWGTMGLLFPLLLPLGIDLSQQQLGFSLDVNNYIVLGTLGSVLAGATLGDHCSPISDTTVMSSMASSCDHIDHVKTQMPYALTSGLISCFFGYIPIGFGVPVWLCLILGLVAMYFTINFLGNRAEQAS